MTTAKQEERPTTGTAAKQTARAESRSRFVGCKFAPSEFAAVKRRAEAAGLSVSALVRGAALDAAREARRSDLGDGFTESEALRVVAYAAEHDLDPTKLVRGAVMDLIDRASMPTQIAQQSGRTMEQTRSLARARVAVTRIGVNLRQVRQTEKRGTVAMEPLVFDGWRYGEDGPVPAVGVVEDVVDSLAAMTTALAEESSLDDAVEALDSAGEALNAWTRTCNREKALCYWAGTETPDEVRDELGRLDEALAVSERLLGGTVRAGA
ncbi:MAG: hypothetical protein WBA38_17460 [Gordonia sp. (in: high G+C Gram-positive bacteria)]|uniref:plasmid mobilization protein n=1 Tax=Gordonia sp. (in: high G+C Gram-positive bacteria) TaxID=84139 RepID=UPI003C764EC0